MAKKAIQKNQIVKLIVGAGQASPSPPVGPALGSKGVKSMDFCKVRPRLTTAAGTDAEARDRNSMLAPPTLPSYVLPRTTPQNHSPCPAGHLLHAGGGTYPTNPGHGV
jgi:hypothetical protein